MPVRSLNIGHTGKMDSNLEGLRQGNIRPVNGLLDYKKNHLVEKVFLKTPVSNMMLALSWDELNLSIDLLQVAFLNLEVSEILTVKI